MASDKPRNTADNRSPKSKHKAPQIPNPNFAEPPPLPKPSKAPKSSAAMAAAVAPEVSKSPNAKRKSRDADPSAAGGGGGKRSAGSAPRRSFEDDSLAILRGAIEFKRRTGAAPTKTTSAAFYDVVKGSVGDRFSESQVFNKLRHLREKLGQSSRKDGDLVHELSVELWQVNLEKKKEIVEKEKKKGHKERKDKDSYVVVPRGSEKLEVDSDGEEEEEEEEDGRVDGKKKAKEEEEDGEEEDEDEDEEDEKEDEGAKMVKRVKEEDGEEEVLGIESLHYVKQAVKEYWKANGLASVALEEGLKLVDPVKARALEEKWKRHLNDEIRLLLDWSKMSRELLVMLHEAHKDVKI